MCDLKKLFHRCACVKKFETVKIILDYSGGLSLVAETLNICVCIHIYSMVKIGRRHHYVRQVDWSNAIGIFMYKICREFTMYKNFLFYWVFNFCYIYLLIYPYIYIYIFTYTFVYMDR